MALLTLPGHAGSRNFAAQTLKHFPISIVAVTCFDGVVLSLGKGMRRREFITLLRCGGGVAPAWHLRTRRLSKWIFVPITRLDLYHSDYAN